MGRNIKINLKVLVRPYRAFSRSKWRLQTCRRQDYHAFVPKSCHQPSIPTSHPNMTENETAVTAQPHLSKQDLKTLDVTTLNPLSPEIISRQATINIGTIGHVAHGRSTVVKAISGVQTVRFKNELERNITIKLGYANAKVYKCDNPECPRPTCYRSYKSEKEVDPPCE